MNKEKSKVEETEIIVVLDRSGSMQSIGEATVRGFNEFIKEQQNAEGKAFITLVQFDHEYQIDYTDVPVDSVNKLIYMESFVPRGTTALHDAIGKTINGVNTDRDVVFVIITDGYENSSREFDKDSVFKMISDKTEAGWNFVYLGANQDAIKAGGDLGIRAGNSLTYSSDVKGSTQAFNSISNNTTRYRKAKIKMSEVDAKAALNFADDQRNLADEKR